MKVLRNGKAVEMPEPRAVGAAQMMREVAAKTAKGWACEAAGDNYQTCGNGKFWDAGTVYDQARCDAAAAILAIPLPEPTPEPQFDSLVVCEQTTTSIILMLRDRGMYQTEDYVKKMDKEIARLSADLEAAREALEPFAAYAGWLEHRSDESYVLSMQRERLDWIHVRTGDFRRARAVLAKLSKGA